MGKTEESDPISGRGRTEITVNHEGRQYVIDIEAELSIDENNLSESYMNQAGRYAWYATVHAASMRAVELAKLRVSVLRADIEVARAIASARLKREMTEAHEKKKSPAQNAIDSILDSQPEVIEARRSLKNAEEDLVNAKYEQEVVKGTKDAFVHRRDMLIQMGADARQEQRDRA